MCFKFSFKYSCGHEVIDDSDMAPCAKKRGGGQCHSIRITEQSRLRHSCPACSECILSGALFRSTELSRTSSFKYSAHDRQSSWNTRQSSLIKYHRYRQEVPQQSRSRTLTGANTQCCLARCKTATANGRNLEHFIVRHDGRKKQPIADQSLPIKHGAKVDQSHYLIW